MKKWILASTLLLAACSSTSGVSYYQLPAQPAVTQVAQQQQVLVVNQVSVADYLSGTGLAYQTNDVEMVLTQQNQWVDNLGSQLTRTLTANLTHDLPSWQVTPTSASANDWQLNTQVERFQGRYDGKVVISGRWLLTHGSQRWQKNFELVLPQNADGYPEMVRVMGAGWQQQAAAIAREVTQIAAGQS